MKNGYHRPHEEPDYRNEVYDGPSLKKLDTILSKTGHASTVSAVAGVLGGVKPGSVTGCNPKIAEQLQYLGLYLVSFSIRGGPIDTMAISRNPEVAEELANICIRMDEATDDDHRKIGRLLGYPPTATDYFIERRSSREDSKRDWLPMIKPKILQGTVAGEFQLLVLSPDNWKEEIDSYIVPIEQATRQLLPDTYRKMERRVRINKLKNLGRRVLRIFGVEPAQFDYGDEYTVKYVE